MEFRKFIDYLKNSGKLVEINNPCSPDLEIAKRIHEHDGAPVLFRNVTGHDVEVVSGLFGFRAAFDLATGCDSETLSTRCFPASSEQSFIHKLLDAVERPEPPHMIAGNTRAPCQEIVNTTGTIDEIPVLKHLSADGGKYITSGVLVYDCPKHGRNCSFHRMMVLDDKHLVARVVENRGLHTALQESHGEPLEAAIIIGNSPQVLLGAATSPEKGIDELGIANSLNPFEIVKCKTINVHVPSTTEIVIEGKFIPGQSAAEGPFMDLTRTLDIVRQQPVFEITCITHRERPIYHALLPGGTEHELLMGLPREATMLQELKHVPGFVDVRLTAGSSHWFNGVVQFSIDAGIDAREIFAKAFAGHGSMKNCILVNDDIDINDPLDIEFAITTRCQFNKDLYLFEGQKGSSLDPSADQVTRETCKVGIDATIPPGIHREHFLRKRYGD